MAYIIFNDIDSRNMGVTNVLSMPLPSRAEQGTNIIEIPGRPEPLMEVKKTFSTISYSVEMELAVGIDVRSIFSWLSGKGKLIFSDEPDKYYNAISCAPVSTNRINSCYRSITVKFTCLPFAYAVDNDAIELTEPEEIITVGGGYYCRPVYKLYGTGNITLTVNNDTAHEFTAYDVDEYVTVDAALMIVHKDGMHVENSGRLPFLAVGDNLIKISGATKLEIVKNERWL